MRPPYTSEINEDKNVGICNKCNWPRFRIKYLLREIDLRTENGMEPLFSMRQTKGLILHSEVSDKPIKYEDLVGYKIVRPGQIVMNRMRASIGLFAATYSHGLVSPDYAVFQPQKPVNLDYLVRFFQTPLMRTIFRKESKGMGTGSSGFLRLYTDRFGAIPISLPPLTEQNHIVDVVKSLDRKISRFLRNKRRLIELLKEQKQNIINRAVTRGLDPNVKLKPSGVEWIGDIPEHWETTKLRSLIKSISIRNRTDLPLLSVVREKGVIIRDIDDFENNHNFIPDDLSNYKVVSIGQFVMNKMKAWQGSYGISEYDGLVSPAYYVFKMAGQIYPFFFHVAIRSKVYIPFFTKASDGVRTGQWDLSISRMNEIPFYFPCLEDQKEIVRFIEKQCLPLDRAISRAEREIELMSEYRTRLISDVVTGKVDVRSIDVPEISEEELLAPEEEAEGEEELSEEKIPGDEDGEADE